MIVIHGGSRPIGEGIDWKKRLEEKRGGYDYERGVSTLASRRKALLADK